VSKCSVAYPFLPFIPLLGFPSPAVVSLPVCSLFPSLSFVGDIARLLSPSSGSACHSSLAPKHHMAVLGHFPFGARVRVTPLEPYTLYYLLVQLGSPPPLFLQHIFFHLRTSLVNMLLEPRTTKECERP
jgi:hypothetical protein